MLKKAAIDRLKTVLALFITVVCVFVLWLFLNSGNGRVETEKKTGLSPKPGLVIGKIKHSATRDGIAEWELEASSAEYINEDKEAVLHDLSLTFHLKNNEKAFVYAKEGLLRTEENDIRLTGNVTLNKQGYNFQTERLVYTHKKRLIHSETPVTLKGNSVYLTADAMIIDLEANKTILKGHVKGAFNDQAHP
jgi:LPS export ABC transporter protein LptC